MDVTVYEEYENSWTKLFVVGGYKIYTQFFIEFFLLGNGRKYMDESTWTKDDLKFFHALSILNWQKKIMICKRGQYFSLNSATLNLVTDYMNPSMNQVTEALIML